MAEKKITWEYENGILRLETPSELVETFDIRRLPAGSSEFALQYGVKQILSDSVAGFEGSEVEKILAMTQKFEALVEGKIKSERLGGTVSKASFMESCKEQGIAEDVAEKLWATSQTKTKEAKKAKKS